MIRGMIVLWYGAIADIPDGWVYCDGTNDTPNLKNRFVIGAGAAYAVDNRGGDDIHSHAFTTDGHSHLLVVGSDIQGGANLDIATTIETDTGRTSSSSNIPPYHALAYIMKT